MKIIFVINSVMQGGIETYLYRFLKYYQFKINPIIICINKKVDKNLSDKFISVGAKIYFIKFNFNPYNLISFFSLVKKNHIKTICDFRGDFSGFSILTSYFFNISNRIVFYRESEYQFKKNLLKLIYIKFSHFLITVFAKKILSNSNASLENFFSKSCLKKKYFNVIYNGVYNENFEIKNKNNIRNKFKIPKNAFVIGHVGRFCEAKNYDLILSLALKLCYNYDDIYFLICGREIEKYFKKKIHDLKLHNKIIFPGHCIDILPFYRTMNLFFFPSKSEGQPNALIEAVLSDVLVVTSDIKPIKECLLDNPHVPMSNYNDTKFFENEILKIYNNNIPYDVKELSNLFKNTYSQKNKFLEFYEELI